MEAEYPEEEPEEVGGQEVDIATATAVAVGGRHHGGLKLWVSCIVSSIVSYQLSATIASSSISMWNVDNYLIEESHCEM